MAGILHSNYGSPRLDLGEAVLEYMIQQDEFIGTKVLPIFRTQRKKAEFTAITIESWLRRGTNVKRAPKTSYERDEFELEPRSYECIERGHEAQLDDSERALYQHDLAAEVACAKLAMRRVLLDQEIDTATLALAATHTTAVGTAWTDPAADIIGDVITAREAIRNRRGSYGDALAVSAPTLLSMLRNTAIRGALGTDKDKTIALILDRLKQFFGVDEIHVGKAVYNSADEGDPYVGANVWTPTKALVFKRTREGDPLQEPHFGRTMLWVEDSPEAVMVEDYPEVQTRSQVYRARNHCDEYVGDDGFAQVLTGVAA